MVRQHEQRMRRPVPVALHPAATEDPVLQLRTNADVSETDRDHARTLISTVLAEHRAAVSHTRIRITGAACAGGPGLVQVNLRVHGAPARIQVAGQPMATALTTAAGRLARQVTRLTTAWVNWPWPDPERRLLGVPGAGTIARLKTYRLHVGAACQAAAFLHAMDFEAHLYTDAETGEDAVIYRCGPTGLRLARQHGMRPPTLPTLLPLTVNPHRTPTLTAADAATRLAEGWLPYLFYTDLDTRRGNLLYRRYDGHLGLIGPAPDIAPRHAPTR